MIAITALGAMTISGCYSVRPIGTAPAPGTRVVLRLNDQGRVAYGERIGASIYDVEGTVAAASDSAIELRILGTRDFTGQWSAWGGEEFRFSRANFSEVRERTFSRGRTALVAAGLVATVISAALTVKLIGGGAPRPGDRDPPPVDQ